MMHQISLFSEIYDAIFKAKEAMDIECQYASVWIQDIIENPNRPEYNECEICSSVKKLEQHHVRGRKHGNEIITVCYDCHKTLTDKQRLWDKTWYNYDSEYKDCFLKRGLIDVCELKHQKTGMEIYKRLADKLTEGFRYE
jgi:hypothetical protein